MSILAVDAGSSAVKAAIVRGGRIVCGPVRVDFPTVFAENRAEADAGVILAAIRRAIHDLGDRARRVDAIVPDNMSPSWLAMDRRGRPLTPVITHQDRRSVEVARRLLQRLPAAEHLRLAGNLPFPGSISSTTLAWHLENAPQVMRRADLVGHLNTFLHRYLTGARVTDPSNASFMGLYSTLDLSGWNAQLCETVGVSPNLLPEVRQASDLAGTLLPQAARDLGLTAGTPVLAGFMDTSAAILMSGMRHGQLINSCGSTDVLALCTDQPRPHERLLTRAVGAGRKWVSVSTIAAAGSALLWAARELFADFTMRRFRRLLARLADRPRRTSVRFENYLAGDRMSIEQRQAAFTGLTLAATREDLLSAIIESLAAASAQRLDLLRQGGVRILPTVLVTGGLQSDLHRVLHRDWPGRWTFRTVREATFQGLWRLYEIHRRGATLSA